MNKITCDICRDLIPLVQDEIASDDSKKAVEEHISECAECRMYYNSGEQVPSSDLEKELGKLKRKLQTFSTVIMMFGIFFGVSLTASEEMFYNSLLMPVIGALGYVIFRWRALYMVPILLFAVHSFINFFGMVRGMEVMTVMGIVMWIGIYSIFVAIGVVIAGLLHFAFRRER